MPHDPFVERVIGTTRREFVDHVLFWIGCDLERKLAEFQTYYNAARSHASLAGRTPLDSPVDTRRSLPIHTMCVGSLIAETSSTRRPCVTTI